MECDMYLYRLHVLLNHSHDYVIIRYIALMCTYYIYVLYTTQYMIKQFRSA